MRIVSSVLAVLTMNDPARFDVRAVPLMVGFVAALAGLAGVKYFTRLPLTLVVFGLAALSGAFVATANAYPGRFSIHLIPVMVTLTTCALARCDPAAFNPQMTQISADSMRSSRHRVT